jgi:hypothetical protein
MKPSVSGEPEGKVGRCDDIEPARDDVASDPPAKIFAARKVIWIAGIAVDDGGGIGLRRL